jgi:hypothetical protein
MTHAFARRTPAHICDRTGNEPGSIANYHRPIVVPWPITPSPTITRSNDAGRDQKKKAVILVLNMFISSKYAAAIDVDTTGSANIEPHHPRLLHPTIRDFRAPLVEPHCPQF